MYFYVICSITRFRNIFTRDVMFVARPAPKSPKKSDKRYISRKNVTYNRDATPLRVTIDQWVV
jgi:hypothetical protein